VTKYDLTHARHDPAHCLAPGLFVSLKRGDRKKFKLDVVYQLSENETIEFSGPEPLGVDDMRILQGLVAMAGPVGIVLSNDPKTETGKQLRLFLEPRWESVTENALVVKGSFRNLAKEIGYADIDGGKTFRDIRASIERLWKVSIIARQGTQRKGYRLLSEYVSDETEGKLFVALNPRLTQAIMGERQHSRIEMQEVRALTTDPARLAHQRLSAWIDRGRTRRITIETLMAYVWPNTCGPSGTRDRKARIRKTLQEIEAVGWSIKEYAQGKYEITRPRTNTDAPPDQRRQFPGLTATPDAQELRNRKGHRGIS